MFPLQRGSRSVSSLSCRASDAQIYCVACFWFIYLLKCVNKVLLSSSTGLLDSGATLTVLGNNFFDKLVNNSVNLIKFNKNIFVKTADGRSHHVVGS